MPAILGTPKANCKKYFSPAYCTFGDNPVMLPYSPEKIITLREALGLNQSELARGAGLSAPTIWALENGKTVEPKYETLRDVAKALGVSLPEIMADEQPSDIDDQILSAAGALSPPNKAALLAAAKALLHSQK
jgi:transcriptional regulator with XRE-family HTH domain